MKESEIEKQPLYQLWHTIYSIKDATECKNALVKKFNLSEKDASTMLAQMESTEDELYQLKKKRRRYEYV
jgi:CRISPR-associated endonuclease Csn1